MYVVLVKLLVDTPVNTKATLLTGMLPDIYKTLSGAKKSVKVLEKHSVVHVVPLPRDLKVRHVEDVFHGVFCIAKYESIAKFLQ